MNQSLTEKPPIHLEMDSSLDELTRLRYFCRDAVESFSSEDDVDEVVGKLQIALVESITNVIRHGFDYQGGNRICCIAKAKGGMLTMEITHRGKPFEPMSIPQIEEPREGGMGLFLVEQCVDEVSYLQLPDGRQCIRLNMNLVQGIS